MFEKILIANRGEIACRIIRTAHRLGIATVAVYSDADATALHTTLAGEAAHIGPSAARESYLCGDKILAAAMRTGAQAIHPGYGFLSENADFCRSCEDAGIAFIGPSASAIEAMGSKAAAKQIMGAARVPMLPGFHGDEQAPAELLKQAQAIGFPVLLKAVSGGGGKGMRRVDDAAGFAEELAAAQREAESSFGDSRMLVEKFLERPRHVEIQVFCDQQGNGIYLAERDCSVQRRHQKVIEEAPAPALSPELRVAMGEAGLRAAQAINYRGAGTVEFLLDEDGAFYFMEMNTRLQVEHPVTEMITGIDLVEWQLRVAAGQPLPKSQQDIKVSGHAFEARIYAEDPNNDFLPATGRLDHLNYPDNSEYIRVDTGVQQADVVSVHYDPMIAKLVCWDQDRDAALRRLAKALAAFQVAGLQTNIAFLHNIACSEPFRCGELSTRFIEDNAQELLRSRNTADSEATPLAALYLLLNRQRRAASTGQDPSTVRKDAWSPWHHRDGWRMNAAHEQGFALSCQGVDRDITAHHLSKGVFEIHWDGQCAQVSGVLNGNELLANVDGFQQRITVAEHGDSYSAFTGAGVFSFQERDPDFGDPGANGTGGNPKAPMNGLIVKHLVGVGERVEKGTPLLVMEAMKMEHTIRAPAVGTVRAFYAEPGELVDGDIELLQFEEIET